MARRFPLTCAGCVTPCSGNGCLAGGGQALDEPEASECDRRRSERGVLGLLEEFFASVAAPLFAGELLADSSHPEAERPACKTA